MTFGTSCTGSAGPLVATAEQLPWRGASCRTSASGFAATAVGVACLGLTSQATLLSAIHPSGLPGCLLSTSIEAVAITVPNGGVCHHDLVIPDVPALVGIQLFAQFLQLDLPPAAAPTSSSSNGLALTTGAF